MPRVELTNRIEICCTANDRLKVVRNCVFELDIGELIFILKFRLDIVYHFKERQFSRLPEPLVRGHLRLLNIDQSVIANLAAAALKQRMFRM